MKMIVGIIALLAFTTVFAENDTQKENFQCEICTGSCSGIFYKPKMTSCSQEEGFCYGIYIKKDDIWKGCAKDLKTVRQLCDKGKKKAKNVGCHACDSSECNKDF